MTRAEIESNYKLLQRESQIRMEIENLQRYITRVEGETNRERVSFFLSRFSWVTQEREEELVVQRTTLLMMLKQAIVDLQEELKQLERQIEEL